MTLKLIGAFLVFSACGGFGFHVAATYRREENTLRQIMHILEYMECELQYRLTPLPSMCRQVSEDAEGVLRRIFASLCTELESQLSPDAERCMARVLENANQLPRQSAEVLTLLGKSLGKFDIEGQLKGLQSVKSDCSRRIETLCQNKEVRLHSYQTLGLCAGAALAILFL